MSRQYPTASGLFLAYRRCKGDVIRLKHHGGGDFGWFPYASSFRAVLAGVEHAEAALLPTDRQVLTPAYLPPCRESFRAIRAFREALERRFPNGSWSA